MSDQEKTKGQLIEELQQLRQQVVRLQLAEVERRRAEEALAFERDLLQTLMDNAPDMIFFKDAESRVIRTSRAHALFLGFADPREAIGKSDFDFFSPEDATRFYAEEQEVMQSRQPIVDRVGQTPDLRTGELRWLSETKAPLMDESGQVVGLLGIARDITERRLAEDELRRSKEFLDNILDALDDPVFVKDEEHRWVILNAAACGQIGLPREELIGKSDYEISSKELADLYWEKDNLVFETGETNISEEPVLWAGELRTASTKKSVYTDPITGKKFIVGTMRDITERKQTELMLERRSNQLQTAAEVSRAAGSILDPDELIQQVVDLVQERFGLYYVGLFLVDQAGEWTGEPDKWAVLRAGTGEAGQLMLAAGHKLSIGGESMIGWCVANQQARIALDVGEEAVRFDNPYLPETRSEMALPLIARGQLIGAMTVQSEEEGAFSGEDIAVLQTMADKLANAIQNARLFSEQQQTALLLSERINELNCLNDIGRKIDETPPVTEFLQWVSERIPPAARYPDLCVAAIEFEGQVYGSPEAMELSCQMVQSFRVGDEVVGKVYIAYREERDFFDADSALLGSIARRVSGYIENRRLFEQTQAALAEVEAAHRSYLRGRWQDYLGGREALQESGVAYDRSSMSALAHSQAHPGVPTQVGGQVVSPTQVAPEPGFWRPEMQRALADGQPVAVGSNGGGEGRTGLAVPIVLRGQTIGVLGLEDPEGNRQWSEEDQTLVEAVSRQLALALENARLMEETRRLALREQQINLISGRARASMNLETILKDTVRELGKALGSSRAFIQLGIQGNHEHEPGQ